MDAKAIPKPVLLPTPEAAMFWEKAALALWMT
jgi:hypothetical protein